MDSYRLTRCELEIMDVVWKRGEATVQQVCDDLTRPLAYTTVMTTLSILESKKRVLNRYKQSRAYIYRPVVSRAEVSRVTLLDLRKVLFADSLPSLMLNLVSDDSLTESDISALKAALEKVEGRN